MRWLSLPAALFLVVGAGAQPTRLIELPDGSRQRMTPDQIQELSLQSHQGGDCPGFIDVTDAEGRIGVMNVDREPWAKLTVPIPAQKEIVAKLLPKLSASELLSNLLEISRYPDRLYDSERGEKAALWVRDRFAAAGGSPELITHKEWRQPTVIARLNGTGPRAGELVVLGAHMDSVRGAPGADDNGSGVAVLLEVFRVLSKSGIKLDRTIEFIGYSAEEVGLRGSQAIAQRYKKEGRKVFGVLNFDMVMYHEAKPAVGVTMQEELNPELVAALKKLVETYSSLPWEERHTCCSDWKSWAQAGFPAANMRDDPSYPHYHRPGDTPDKLDASYGLEFAKVALAFAVELGLAR